MVSGNGVIKTPGGFGRMYPIKYVTTSRDDRLQGPSDVLWKSATIVFILVSKPLICVVVHNVISTGIESNRINN